MSTAPVYDKYFADPFVFRHGGTYYAVGTGPGEAAGATAGAGRVIPLLRSEDLRTWEFVQFALERPDPKFGNEFWAPEVAFDAGTFYLYYSVGHGDKNHQIRVAASDAPEGPYRDVAGPLHGPDFFPPFAIDPHPFRDPLDGTWYLFYARDFLDTANGYRAGTGLAVDRLIDMTRLAGEERTVMRAKCDWQRFKRDRPMYGNVYDWHTLEGPCVRVHDGQYFCLYSGGCWENATYGVDFVVSDRATGPYDDDSRASNGPRVLRTMMGILSGPGHCSIVEDVSGNEFVAYHAWNDDATARVMYIDELTWTDDGPRVSISQPRAD